MVVAGTLYIVPTPIGNLGDISARALEVLGAVDAIAAEDTRTTARLLQHFGLHKPLIALHDHNEKQRGALLVERLQRGESLALVSEAGTPLISDPGYSLVAQCHQAGCRVLPLPGPCAAVAALSAAGLPTDRFVFEGFLPARSSARRSQLQGLLRETRTLVFYESPRRVMECLADLQAVFGRERPAALAKELTKIHEAVISGTLATLEQWLQDDSQRQQGEFVLMVAGAPALDEAASSEAEGQRLLALLIDELPLKKAAAVAASFTGAGRNALYQYGLSLRQGE
ncbi:MAG: 16S rRNA (cytidine(1402)-2'-O)-methyltransferase [Gammaproteobacteria bacterium]|nr:16S rRNA (cytidine(1402)-2'-O)-methyltransferase [Gammaproteobacteria bacterium]